MPVYVPIYSIISLIHVMSFLLCNVTLIGPTIHLQVLMIRLSFHARLDDCMILSWLHLLHNYFKELLQQPITEVESVQDDCLEGSPFLMSVTDGELYNMGSPHLQRQAVFLFLRCSFTLVSLKEDTKKHCACSAADSCLTFDANSDLDCCGRKKGLLELYKWLQRHLPIDKIVDYEIYMEKCINFSLSFLQLYMHEVCLLFLKQFSLCFSMRYEDCMTFLDSFLALNFIVANDISYPFCQSCTLRRCIIVWLYRNQWWTPYKDFLS